MNTRTIIFSFCRAMIFLGATTSEVILQRAIETFLLEKNPATSTSSFSVWQKGSVVFVHATGVFRPKDFFTFVQENFIPDYIVWLGFAKWISNEHYFADVILPNVFLSLNEDIFHSALSKENRDMFLGKALFLETYTLQNDYNFDRFGLSIGWICVTGVIPEIHEKEASSTLQITYEADVLDTESYQLLQEAQVWGLTEKMSVVVAINNAPKSKEHADVTDSAPSENVTYITRFLFDAFLEKEKGVFAEEEDEEEENDTGDVDDDYDEDDTKGS